MHPALNIPVVLGIAIFLAACEGGGAPRGETAMPMAPAGEVAPADSTHLAQERKPKRRSTSPKLAIANLNGQIAAFEARTRRFPNDIASRERLVELLLARTQFLGSYEDFDTAFQIVDDTLKRKLSPVRGALMHAGLLAALHRFDAAIAELDRAERLGSQSTLALRQTIAIARGSDPSAAHEGRAALAAERPSYVSLTKVAASLTALERYEEADEAYAEALSLYRDVSPFPLAWVAFQRGAIWGEKADDSERAYQQYQEAVERLPQYVVGNVHLSELEVQRGERAAAITRLERIVDSTMDPEPASRLAQYLQDAAPRRASQYREQARSGYEALLARYPLAFADHATEFYLGAGADPKRALELALLNRENRNTSRAQRLVDEAASAVALAPASSARRQLARVQ